MNKESNLKRIEDCMDAMRRAMTAARERLGEGLQLTRTQLEILIMLSERSRTTKDLASALFLTGSAVTQTIETLVRRDFVTRTTDEHDRRIIMLHLSEAGREVTQQVCSLKQDYMKSLAESLTDEEIEVLVTLTGKVTEELNNAKAISKENVRGFK